ncbi:MAG: molecular chaperone HtpG [Alphaproteobacteria bacterium]
MSESVTNQDTNVESHVFQTEVSRLLDIVANALYSNKDVFLRELVSNASDACDKLRYMGLSDAALLGDDTNLEISISIDKDAKTLAIRDNGIGMDRADLIDKLGTIAKSGTSEFLSNLKADSDSKDKDKGGADSNLIGQFGVGFYASFMVADKVEVRSRKAGAEKAFLWRSDGKGAFELEEVQDQTRGTEVLLFLKDEAQDYLGDHKIRQIIKTYSDHLAFPVLLLTRNEEEGVDDKESSIDQETLTEGSALWTRSKSDISDDQYNAFYKDVSGAFDEPWSRLHFSAEGRLEYKGLLFVPSSRPYDLFHQDRRSGLKLYVNRVFISDEMDKLLPSYLRFVKGVVDVSDLPLNISRELLQDDPRISSIRDALTKRLLKDFDKKAKDETSGYSEFWANFGAVVKEGLYEDFANQEALLNLTRFQTVDSEDWVSLADYVAGMPEGQNEIFYISGDNRNAALNSPHLEGFRKKGVSVLVMTDPIDEFWMPMVREFDGKTFQSVTRGTSNLDDIKAADDAEETPVESHDEEATAKLIAFLKTELDGKVKDVRTTTRLETSAVCFVADESDMDVHMAKLMKAHQQLDKEELRIMELNPKHALVRALSTSVSGNAKMTEVKDIATVLLDLCRVQEGQPIDNPLAFASQVAGLAEKSLV